ncbi:MAG: hypothetical protein O3A60_11155 [Planctomycetota bacterium]|nr:hypothetical protein [Planctomycetota bacterium]
MVTINKMREMLCEGFPEPQADLMARVFFSAHDELVTKAEFNELTAVTRELAEAQHMLANAQARTESRVEQLANAQARTESRVEQLADAQARTEWAIKDLAKQVGGLSNALGGSLEDFACDLVPEMLEKYWQMEVQSAATEELLIGRRYREIDVVVRGTVAGKPVTVLCEVKATVSRKEVDGFLAIIERYRSLHPDEDIRPLFFGYKADRRARERIVAEGTAMVFTRGVMLPVPRS